MDLYRLNETNPNNNTKYMHPDYLIEGYTSLIWTERYIDPGDFQLKTPRIAETREILKDDCIIGIRGSDETMIVESHSINTDDRGQSELIVTGRSYETFMETRPLKNQFQEYVLDGYTTSEVVMYIINNRIFSTAWDASWFPTGFAIDESTLADAVVDWPDLPISDVYTFAYDTLKSAGLGLRTRRGRPRNEFWTGPGDQFQGEFIYGDDRHTINTMIYNGINRSEDVVFDWQSGHINGASYLFSTKDYRNVAFVTDASGEVTVVYAPGFSLSQSQYRKRRILQVDATPYASTDNTYQQIGLIELAKHNKTFLFDGEISQESPFSYGKDYFLGDTVTLRAEYGVNQPMQVTEYIRTEDSEGDRGYPTLAEPFRPTTD